MSDIWNTAVLSVKNVTGEKCRWTNNTKFGLAIVEPREHKWLKGVLNNMAHVYGGCNVSLHIFCSKINHDMVMNILIGWENVQVHILSADNLSTSEYNALLTSTDFWKRFKEEFILIFQTDTLIRRKIDDLYFRYDYVGAPWTVKNSKNERRVGNGGWSLRKVNTIIDTCEKHFYDKRINEDVYYAMHIKKVPSVDEASRFSVEHIYNNDPCGMHQAYRFHTRNQITELLSCLPGI